MKKIMIVNGPNLNLLGRREPGLYGDETLDDLKERLTALARKIGLELEFFQSNHEGELVEAIQRAAESCDGAVLNAGAYTHTSVALRDAVLGAGTPVVEVHLTNPAAREPFRRKSLLSGAAVGLISGFGFASYELALVWFAGER
jgi:3-dehydroquinate dehydratase-2